MLGLYLKIFYGLNRAAAFSWPFLLLAGKIRGRQIVKETRWANAGANPDELKYVHRLAVASAIYITLKEKKGKMAAFELMRIILVSFGRLTVRRRFHSVNLSGLTGMERLRAFNDHMVRQDEARHNDREYVEQSDTVCHYRINHCLVHDFFDAAGTPELTRLICEVDQYFFPRAFAEFDFSRGNSMENTIAYGKPYCDFILKLEQQ